MVSVLHGFIGVLHEIEEGLFAQAFVERNEWKSVGVVALQEHGFARLLCARRLLASKAIRDNLQDAIEQSNQIRGMRFGVQRTSEIQKLGDERTEAVDLSRNVSG